jgi:hypothetical protein
VLENNLSSSANRFLSFCHVVSTRRDADADRRRSRRRVLTFCYYNSYAFINAAMHIKAGQADLILAGGTEAAVTPMGLAGFIACRALSSRNDAPTAASRPWDKGRDGFVMGEARPVITLVPIRPRRRGERRSLRTFLPGGRFSSPTPRFQFRYTSTPFNSQV